MYTGNPKMGTLANSVDPEEMQDNAAFHQGLHCLLRLKQSSGRKTHHDLEMSTCDNGQFYTYCINVYEKIHQNTKC